MVTPSQTSRPEAETHNSLAAQENVTFLPPFPLVLNTFCFDVQDCSSSWENMSLSMVWSGGRGQGVLSKYTIYIPGYITIKSLTLHVTSRIWWIFHEFVLVNNFRNNSWMLKLAFHRQVDRIVIVNFRIWCWWSCAFFAIAPIIVGKSHLLSRFGNNTLRLFEFTWQTQSTQAVISASQSAAR